MERHRLGVALDPDGRWKGGGAGGGAWRRLLCRHSFGCSELEALYRRYVFRLRISALVAYLALLGLLAVALSVLNFVYLSRVTVENLYHISMAGVFGLILVYLHSRYMRETHLQVIVAIVFALSTCFCIIALPLNFGDRPRVLYTPVEGVWEVLIVVFLVYALLPVRMCIAMVTGVVLPCVHVVVSVLLANDLLPTLLWRQVSPHPKMSDLSSPERFTGEASSS